MRRLSVFIAVLVLLASVSVAHEDDLVDGKKLVESKADCASLTTDQLEKIGEYIMEQAHPGDSHEAMHKTMGLTEGSEAEEQMHISMARAIYCGESGGMMDGGMMNMMDGNMMSSGMAGQTGALGSIWWVFSTLFAIGLFVLVWLLVFKYWKEAFGKRR